MIRLQAGEYLSSVGIRRDLPIGRIVETRYRTGMRLPRHTHEFPYLLVMIDGVLRERACGREHDLGVGWLVYNQAGEVHEDILLAGHTRCLNVELSESLLQRLADEGARPAEAVAYRHAGAATAAVARLYAALIDPDPTIGAEEAVIDILAAAWGCPEAPAARRPVWLPRVIERLHDRVSPPPTLADLAACAGVQHVHLCRAFKRAVGCTIGDYLRRLRAAEAFAAVTRDRAPLSGVAAGAGYADQAHMTREFQRLFGRSPGGLRRELSRNAE